MEAQNNYFIGFDLGGSSLKYGYGNSQDSLLYSNKIYHKDKNLPELINIFEEAFTDLKKYYNKFTALGLASPGIIDTENGIVLGSTPNIPFIKGINLKDILQNITSIPVFIDNDANLMTFAEAFHLKSKSTLGVTIGSGIGTGFYYNSQLPTPNSQLPTPNSQLQAGHTIIIPNGRECKCGKKGCLEAYCSADSIKRIVNESLNKENLNIAQIINSSDSKITNIIYNLLDILSIGLANISMILHPDTIIIGGGVIEIKNFDFTYLKKQILIHLTPEFHDINIKKAYYGNNAGTMGAILWSEHQNSVLLGTIYW